MSVQATKRLRADPVDYKKKLRMIYERSFWERAFCAGLPTLSTSEAAYTADMALKRWRDRYIGVDGYLIEELSESEK